MAFGTAPGMILLLGRKEGGGGKREREEDIQEIQEEKSLFLLTPLFKIEILLGINNLWYCRRQAATKKGKQY